MGVLSRSPNPFLRLDFLKIQVFALFLAYIPFKALYDYDFFTDVKTNISVSNIHLYVSKKIRVIQRLKRNTCKEKCKKLNFQETQSQNGVGTSCQNAHFSLETFLSNGSRKFFRHSMTMFKVFKRCI